MNTGSMSIPPMRHSCRVRSAVEQMSGYAPGEQPPPGKTIKLNTNENPYPMSPRVALAIREALDRGLQRYPDPMATAFRMRAASLHGVTPDHILCGNGSDELLTIVVRTFVDAGQAVRFPTPSYILYGTLAKIQGATSQAIRFRRDWSLPEEFFVEDDHLHLILLANPNSPSGLCIRPDVILKLAMSVHCPVIVDEAYVDFARQDCLSLIHQCDRIVILRSLSKSYALAGLRFGYAVAHPWIIQQMAKVKDSYNCDALSVAGATAAIDDQAWLDETRGKMIATRQRTADALRSIGFDLPVSEANFLWCTHPSWPLRKLFEELRQDQVFVRYLDYPGWGDGLRISIGTDEQMALALDAMKTRLRQLTA